MPIHEHYNPNFFHHQHSFAYIYGREIVFGMQDGMVSLLGALTGIAVGSQDHFIIVLSGFSIIFTASLSMAIGTFNSLSTERKIENRIIDEEKEEIEKSPIEEKEEVEELFVEDGWPKDVAEKMAECAARDNRLMLQEMSYRELGIFSKKLYNPIHKSIVMFFSWMLGGLFPLIPYLFLPVNMAIKISVVTALLGLFVLGSAMSKFTKQKISRAGLEMALIGGTAMISGFIIGQLVDFFVQH
ncbi:MAG: VIT1/CCC1 transporter family protein [Candidatus Magasanikbacteria bacterium]